MSESRKKLEEEQKYLEKTKYQPGKSEWTTEEEEKRLAEIRRLEQRNKEMIKWKKGETKRIVNAEISILKGLAEEERNDAHKYRSAATHTNIPTMKKLLLDLGSEEEQHARRLETLATELERRTLLY